MGRTGAINAKLHVLLHFVMFWCIWDHFVCALNSMQMGQSGAINAKDRAANSRQIFSQRTHPIHTMVHKTQVLLHFVMFGSIWDRFATALNSVQMGQSGANNAKVRATKSRLNLSLRTRPIHTIGP